MSETAGRTIRDFSNILVLVAMDAEKDAILSTSKSKKAPEAFPFGLEAYRFSCTGGNVFLATTGVGIANAAVATALFADRLAIDAILLLGVGGSLSPLLGIGDMVLGLEVLQHDCRFSGENGSELMTPGELFLSKRPEERGDPALPAHPAWLEWLRPVLKPVRCFEGTILSGNEFAGNPERKKELSRLAKNALLVDMEAAGVAQVARKLGIPFGVVKTVSDRLSPEGAVAADYRLFLRKAAEQSSLIFSRLLSEKSLGAAA